MRSKWLQRSAQGSEAGAEVPEKGSRQTDHVDSSLVMERNLGLILSAVKAILGF